MRFRALELRRYGHFSDAALSFGAPGPEVHVVFGHNEAGKSTTRRAIEGLLFGIEERTRDAHVHDGQALRIAATVESAAGEVFEVVRRKGRKNTLLGPDEAPIDEAVLARMFSGVTRELYATMFSLDHHTLVEGGEALREGAGELGESLFAAGTGLRGLHALREQLRGEADAIFTPRASTKALNVTLREYAVAARTVREKSLQPGEWKTLTETLEADEAALGILEARRRDLERSIARLERLLRTVPAVVERAQCIERRNALGEVPQLPDDAPLERREAEAGIRRAEQRRRELAERRGVAEHAREALTIDRQVLERSLRIDALAEPLGVYRQAMRDRTGLQADAAAGEAFVRSLMRELGRDDVPEDLDALRIPPDAQARIRALARDHERLAAAVVSARQELASAERTFGRQRSERERLPAPRDATALAAALHRARQHGGLEERERVLATDARTLETRVRERLDALGLWAGEPESALALPLPVAETVDRFEKELGEAERAIQRSRERRDEVDRLIAEGEAERARLSAHGSVPTREARDEARAERDALWSAAKGAWLDAAVPEVSPETLAARYEGAVAGADAMSDALFDDAERATRYAALGADLASHRERRARLAAEHAASEQMAAEAHAAWRAVWTAVDIEPLPPAEMRAWLGRHATLAASIGAWKTKVEESAQARSHMDSLRTETGAALTAVGEMVPEEGASFASTIARAEAVHAAIAGTATRRTQLDAAIADAQRALAERRDQLEQDEAALAAWRGEWAGAVATLVLPADATPEAAETVLSTLSRVFERRAEIDALRRRLDLIDAQVAAFAADVEALVGECAPDLGALRPDAAAEGLVARLHAAREAVAEHQQIDRQLDAIVEEVRRCNEERRAADATLARLMADAGCDSIPALEDAEARSQAHRKLSARIESLDEQLDKWGVPVDVLVAEAEGVDLDAIPGEKEALDRERDAVVKEERALLEQVGGQRQEMKRMDGRAEAAAAAEEAEQRLAQMHEQVSRYARLRIAAALLERELERHRGEGQGPLIERAGEMFSRLTLGGYAGLATGFGAKDEIVLECLRAGGAPVRVEALSDGTRDQLYLALRLASIEQHVSRNESLPLVVDDALVNFDDPRSRAAFELLGEIANRTQVLFFTHHAHMLDLARAALSPTRCVEHDLDAVGATPA